MRTPARLSLMEPPEILRVCMRAAHHARGYGIGTPAFLDSIAAVHVDDQRCERALFVIERRRVVRRTAALRIAIPARLDPPPSAAGIDAWSVDPVLLAEHTRAMCRCPACDGELKIRCRACEGRGTQRCARCGGSGVGFGARGPGVCLQCHGAGGRVCLVCSRGRSDCNTCAGRGVVLAWLAIERTEIRQVRSDARSGMAAIEDWYDPNRFDQPPCASALVADTGVVKVPPSDPAQLTVPPGTPPMRSACILPVPVPKELLPEPDPRTDRIVAVRLQQFTARLHRIEYASPFGHGTVTLGPGGDAIDPRVWAPLRRRRLVLLLASGFVASEVLLVHGAFVRLHDPASTAAMLFWSTVAAAFVVRAFAGWLLPAHARTPARVTLPLCLAALCALAAATTLTTQADVTTPEPRCSTLAAH